MTDSADIQASKRALRKKMIGLRSSLSAEEARARSERIAAQLDELPEYTNAKAILFYVSAKPNEVDTHVLIRKALSDGVMVLVPITDFDKQELIISELKNIDELAPAKFGLLEPPLDLARPTDPAEADVIIVPGVAFDRRCRRLGFGGGYYDRLLADSSTVTIALGYDAQLVKNVPTDSYDMPVDILVTEDAVYRAEPHD